MSQTYVRGLGLSSASTRSAKGGELGAARVTHRLCRIAGIGTPTIPPNPRDLRRSFITLGLEAGASLRYPSYLVEPYLS